MPPPVARDERERTGGATPLNDAEDAGAEALVSVVRPPPCLFLKNHILSNGYVLVVAESFRARYAEVQPFLASLAEPVSRPPLMHEYHLTPFSLGTAVSNGVTAEEVMTFLQENTYELHPSFHKGGAGGRDPTAGPLYSAISSFVTSCMVRYDLARIVVEPSRTVVQCKDLATATLLLNDKLIRSTVVQPPEVAYEPVRWDDNDGEEVAMHPCFCLQRRALSKAVAARCVVLGLPIQQRYGYEEDASIRQANITLRSQTKPRPYQVEAVEAATSDGVLHSGCLVLPCGAGKTLLGIMLLCKVKKPSLIVCAGSVSVEQWKNQILEYATLEPPTNPSATVESNTETTNRRRSGAGEAPRAIRSGAARISCLTGKQKDNIDEDTDVVLTTYSMLVSAHRAYARMTAQQSSRPAARSDATATATGAFTERGTRKRKRNPKEQLFSSYGLLILDEVHVMPAEAFQESLSCLDVKGTIGLTATYVREDRRILDLFHLVGPKLYDVSMETLAVQGYLAKVNCVEVHTSMTKEFGTEYLERSAQTMHAQRTGKVPVLVMLAAANPNKMVCVQQLVERHLDAGSKILVFCDHIVLLHEYGELLRAPVISGKTQHKDRLMIFSDFQSTSKVNVICVSRVGDVSVNLPSANVVIQVSSHGGSRRQEAQRLGRILRPKDRAANGRMVEAWFYSIISSDTVEVVHAARRTAFLVDQGYTCRLMHFNAAETRLRMLEEAQQRPLAKLLPPKAAKEDDPVGDVASIKQEYLHRSGPRGTATPRRAVTMAGGEPVRSLTYQLGLLSKVVSHWEIEYQQEASRRKRGRGADGTGGDSESQLAWGRPQGERSDEDAVVVVEEGHHERGYAAIKEEWNAQQGQERDSSRGCDAAPTTISDLVGVNDGFVYHEL